MQQDIQSLIQSTAKVIVGKDETILQAVSAMLCGGHVLLEDVPGLKLVFDTGNPVFTLDKSKPKPYPQESSWEFYEHVRDHIVYVHIKDGTYDVATKKTTYTWPGEGDGDVKKIVADLIKNGYDGGFSMEPHMQLVFHDSAVTAQAQAMYDNYVEYGRRFMKIVEDCKKGM